MKVLIPVEAKDAPLVAALVEMVSTMGEARQREGIELLTDFHQIDDPEERRKIIYMTKGVAVVSCERREAKKERTA